MKSTEIIRRANELLSDIEGGKLTLDLLCAKALTLAKIAGDPEPIEWLTLEISGYAPLSSKLSERYAILTKRWDGTSDKAYPGSAADISQHAELMRHSLEVEKQFKPSSDGWALLHQKEKAGRVSEWASAIAPLEKILAAIRVQLHLFASRILVEAQFSDTSKAIFDRFQADVDRTLATTARDAFEKLPRVFERLRDGDREAVSHALTSCRRIVDSFADAVFPPRDEPIIINGQRLEVGADKTKNRVRAYLAQHIDSESRRERLNRNLVGLYDRVSAGVHADVAIDEAQALVLNTYLLLGEIVSLPPKEHS